MYFTQFEIEMLQNSPRSKPPPNLRMNIIWCFYFKIDVTFHWQTVDIQPSQQNWSISFTSLRWDLTLTVKLKSYSTFQILGLTNLKVIFRMYLLISDLILITYLNLNCNFSGSCVQKTSGSECRSIPLIDRPDLPNPGKGKYETHEIKSGDS